MRGTFSLLFLSFVGFTAAGRCPAGWSNFQNSCYLFPNVMATWGTALDICIQLESYLVEIETPEENNFIEKKKHNKHNYWTGGNDIELESEWRWVTSRHVFKFTDWDRIDRNNLQPNNLHHREDCMLIYHIHHKWHDASCGDKNFFICERSAEQVVPVVEQVTTTTEPEPNVTPLVQEMTTSVQPDMSTTALPDMSTTAQPDMSTTALPDMSTTAQPDMSTTALPDMSTTAQPDMSTTAQPDMSTTALAQPDMSTTAQPDMSTTTQQNISTTARPDMSTTARLDMSTTAQQKMSTTKEPISTTVNIVIIG